DGVPNRADCQRVAVDRDSEAEEIYPGAVAGVEFLLRRPVRAATLEDVGRTLLAVRANGVKIRPSHQSVAAERNGKTEKIIRRAVAGRDFLLLRPGRAAARENVGRTLTAVCSNGVKRRADRQRVAVERDCPAELIMRSAVVGGEFLLQ